MMKNRKREFGRLCSPAKRRGAIAPLAAFFAIVAVGMVAFSVDVGYLLSTQQELQRCADAAALAACWEFAEEIADDQSEASAVYDGRVTAGDYAIDNWVGGNGPLVNYNWANSASGDVVFGEIDDLYAANASPDTSGSGAFNGVRVTLRRDQTLNGEVPLFFAKVFGRSGQAMRAEATAGYMRYVSGFETPPDNSNIGILPIALDEYSWNELLAGNAPDVYAFDPDTGSVTSNSPDGKLEISLFPEGTGAPGNRGTVDIGGNDNSTDDIARQVVYGLSPSDLAHYGGVLQFDENGELILNGDTGISAGIKDELASIIGEPRMIPVFSTVQGPGNNAQFTIVKWVGIRVVSVKLTGPMHKKHVTIQPAPYISKGAIAGSAGDSDYVYSPVVLVR